MIDYKKLRRTDPETARQAVLDYLAWAGGNVAATARAFGINRTVVYDILARSRSGSLADRPRTPHRQPFKTPPRVEARVVAARNRTGLGYQRLSHYLAARGLQLPWSTIRNILRRNRHRLRPAPRRRKPRPPARAPAASPAPPGETPIESLRRRAWEVIRSRSNAGS
jgi:transposase-like protein